MKRLLRWILPAMALAILAAIGIARADDGSGPAALYQRMVQDYLDGKFDDLDTVLKLPPAQLSAMTADQRADLLYIRQAQAECRPPWWDQCKAGKKFPFQPGVWGHAVPATFDPDAKMGVQMKFTNGSVSVTLGWKIADMDNPAEAEHGFSKGELADLSAWMSVGMAQAWGEIPIAAQLNLTADQKLRFSRYLDFRDNAAAIEYASPRARRWGLWLSLAAYMEKYAKMPTVMSRKAMGAIFLEEILEHPGRYPSIKLPQTLGADAAEAKLADAVRSHIESNGWTLAEDKAIREAVKALAATNGLQILATASVKLPNGLTVLLDPQADKPNQAKRDAWIKQQFDRHGN